MHAECLEKGAIRDCLEETTGVGVVKYGETSGLLLITTSDTGANSCSRSSEPYNAFRCAATGPHP